MKKLLILTLMTLCAYANMPVEHVLGKGCLHSYNDIYKPAKNHKAFVYAREKDTGNDRCVWWFDRPSLEEAIEASMKRCQTFILDAECVLVDQEGVFQVKDGTFTPLLPADNRPLSKDEKTDMLKKAKSLILGNCYPFFTDKYLNAKGHKSFAYSIDPNGDFACGYAYEQIVKTKSDNEAIKACKRNKGKRGNAAPKSPCKIYAYDRQILLSAKDFGINIEHKEDKSLDEDAYQKKLSKAKEIIKGGACLRQMKYYLRGKTQQAFYFTKSGDKQACGRKEKAFTLKKAKEDATKACEKMAKEKGIKKPCKLLAQNYEIVGKVIDFASVAKEGKEDLKDAIYKGDLQKIKTYISKGYDINTKEDTNGMTPLFIAVIKGDVAFFNTLTKKGADITQKAKDGSTLLIAAVSGSDANIEIVKTLLDKGIDVNAKGFGGNTALHLASMTLNEKAIKLLLSHGADKSITNDKGLSSEQILKSMMIDIETLRK